MIISVVLLNAMPNKNPTCVSKICHVLKELLLSLFNWFNFWRLGVLVFSPTLCIAFSVGSDYNMVKNCNSLIRVRSEFINMIISALHFLTRYTE
jgi:hypothetical protein